MDPLVPNEIKFIESCGLQGWELVSVVDSEDHLSRQYREFYFKRPK